MKEEQLTDFFNDSQIASMFYFITKACNENAEKHGFWKDEDDLISFIISQRDNASNATNEEKYRIDRIISLFNSEKIALEMSELAERLETLRTQPTKLDEHCPEFLNIEIEVADLIIRALDFCGRRDLRIGNALVAKMKFNKTREFKHGKAF